MSVAPGVLHPQLAPPLDATCHFTPSSGESHTGDQAPGWPDLGALICQLVPGAHCHLRTQASQGHPGSVHWSPEELGSLSHSFGKQNKYVHTVYAVLHIRISSLAHPPFLNEGESITSSVVMFIDLSTLRVLEIFIHSYQLQVFSICLFFVVW